MASSRFRDLQAAALILRNRAPEEWELFLRQFSEMARRTTIEMVHADQSMILTAQGMARLSVTLFDALLKCEEVNQPQQPAPPPSP